MKELHAIVDLQYGSTGKGLFAAYLAGMLQPDTILTAWGPNAGHTVVNPVTGEKHVHTMLPCGIHGSRNLKRIMMGPGSVIDMVALQSEAVMAQIDDIELVIHEAAIIVSDRHRDAEREYGFRIGSTMKGVGEAVCEKIRRDSIITVGQRYGLPNRGKVAINNSLTATIVDSRGWCSYLEDSDIVLAEGAQGYSLSINHGFYPHVTSRDCTVQQLFVDCAIPLRPLYSLKTYGVARTFPIRVANRVDGKGSLIGTSGPCYADQREINWSDIGLEPELTTVTKLPRRIFTFSPSQVQEACVMNGVDEVFLNFCNYGAEGPMGELGPWRTIREEIQTHTPVRWTGWGPKVTDIREE